MIMDTYNSADDTVSTSKEVQSKKIAVTAVFAALVTIATLLVRIPEPAAGGYLDIGDSVIFITAMLFGRTIGGIAGGIGSMFADLINGAPEYAPATLVIKGMEGFVTGYVFSKLKDQLSSESTFDTRSMIRILFIGIVASFLLIVVGLTLDSIMIAVWLLIVVGLFVAIFLSIFKFKIRSYYLVLSMTAGAAVMVFGYMFYYIYGVTIVSNLIYGPSAAPLVNWGFVAANSPFDAFQALVCVIIGLILYEGLYKSRISDII
jgi:uncharacterized membrane protein